MTKKKKQQEGPAPIRLLELEVRNFRRLRFAHVRVGEEGELVRITGPNYSGKTSVLLAIQALLGPSRKVVEGAVNDEGDGTGAVRGTFSNGFTVERHFTGAAPKGYLRIRSADGGRYDQERLDEWTNGLGGDLMYLWSLKPELQRGLLQNLAGGKDLDRRLLESRTREEALRAERTPHNSAAQRVARIQAPQGERPERVDVAAELERLEELRRRSSERANASLAVEHASRARNDAAAWVKAAEDELAKAKESLTRCIAEEEEAAERFNGLPDVSAEIAELRDKIADANEVEDRLAVWLAYEREVQAGAEAKEKAAQLTQQIEECQAERRELVAGLESPVPGLSFDDQGEPLLKGRPLFEASLSERMMFGADVVFAVQPQLRVLLVDQGEALDADSLAQLQERAKAGGFQVWFCRIRDDEGTEVEVLDGVALSEGVESREAVEEALEAGAPGEEDGGEEEVEF